MWLAWVVAIAILVAGVVTVSHLGVDVISLLARGFHDIERFLGTSL